MQTTRTPEGAPIASANLASARRGAAPVRRVRSVDIVRGAVMVLMALDHVRDYVQKVRVQPENLAQSTAALFATRWVTHFCAPAFSLLAGVGIGISMNRGRSAREMSTFLLTRGLWLIVLDVAITPVLWRFSFNILPAFALVLWALGLSMMVMAALVHLPRAIVAAGAIVMIATHNLLDGVGPESWGALRGLWHVLHVPGFAVPGKLFIGYPLVPWVAVMALGWALATVYTWDDARRRRFLVTVGVAATLLFLVVRGLSGYGDPGPWSAQRSTALTIASFLNARKYPPSLDFLLMTLGPTLAALALLETVRGRVVDWLSVYGRVPLFYYVVHIGVAHAVGVLLALVQHGQLMRITAITDPAAIPAWYGVSLPGVYVAWAIVVIAMYPLCRWFARLKQTRTDRWLQYL